MLLRDHADFRLLWLAQVVSQLGDKVYALTLSWWVFFRWHRTSFKNPARS